MLGFVGALSRSLKCTVFNFPSEGAVSQNNKKTKHVVLKCHEEAWDHQLLPSMSTIVADENQYEVMFYICYVWSVFSSFILDHLSTQLNKIYNKGLAV